MSEWISVKDRLPEYGDGNVLIAYKQGGIYIDSWDEEYEEWDDAGIDDDITHWMPLPEPPKDI